MNSRILSGALSLVIAVGLLMLGIAFSRSIFGIYSHPVFVISVSVSIPMIVYGSIDYRQFQRVRKAERRLPDLLRDLSNYTSFGIPLSEAFTRIRGNSYDTLGKGVQRVAGLVSAGVGFNDAIARLGEGITSSRIAMVSKILQKSNESGSNTSDVIWILSEFTTRSELLEESRSGDMKNYNMVMLISFAVFLFVILFLDLRFLNVILSYSLSSGSFIRGTISSSSIERAFSVGVLAQAIAIGVISGLLRDIRITSGLLMTGVLVAASSMIFFITGVY